MSILRRHVDKQLTTRDMERSVSPVPVGGGRLPIELDAHEAATCEARGINPFEYLADVLARVQDHPASDIDAMLPGDWIAARDDD